jgi:hypothetical protein
MLQLFFAGLALGLLVRIAAQHLGSWQKD